MAAHKVQEARISTAFRIKPSIKQRATKKAKKMKISLSSKIEDLLDNWSKDIK